MLGRIDELSDDESQSDVDQAEEDVPKNLDLNNVPCSCTKRCLAGFTERKLNEKWCRELAAFQRLHKLDQDAWLFDRLRSLALAQGQLQPDGTVKSNFVLEYQVCGQHVCRKAFCLLYGIGSGRFMRIKKAVSDGRATAPIDLRFCKQLRRGAHP